MSEAFIIQPSDAVLLEQLAADVPPEALTNEGLLLNLGRPIATISNEARARLAQFPRNLVITQDHWDALKLGVPVIVTSSSQESFDEIVKMPKRKNLLDELIFGDLSVIPWICCLIGAAVFFILGNALR